VGLAALAATAVGIVTILSDFGIGGALITKPSLSRVELASALGIALLIGSVTATLLAAASPLAASIWRTPELQPLLLWLALNVLLHSALWIIDPLLLRDLRLDARFVVGASQGVVALVSTVSMLSVTNGATAFVVGQVVGTACALTIGYFFTRPLPAPRLDAATVRPLMTKASPFLAQGATAWLSQNSDNALIGYHLGNASLGTYSFVFRLVEVPYSALADPVGQRVFAHAAQEPDRREVAREYLTSLRLVSWCAFPVLAAFIVVGPHVLPLVLGNSWRGQDVLILILGVWGIIRSVQGLQGWLVNGLGGASLGARVTIVVLLVKVPLLWFAAQHSLEAVAAVMLASMVAQYAALMRFVGDAGISNRLVALAIARVALPVLVLGAATWTYISWRDDWGDLIGVSLVFAAVAAVGLLRVRRSSWTTS
jgi:PST family polysaccharide transporter